MTQGPRVVAVFPEDFPQVFPLLARLDSRRPPEAWRPIFDYPWRQSDEPVGYALRRDDRLLGYMGTIWSQLPVDGELERFCNITSWIVVDEARGAGALLILQLLRRHDATITSFTPNARARGILLRMGFRELGGGRISMPSGLSGLLPRRKKPSDFLYDPEHIRFRLDTPEARIMEDHRRYAHHLLIPSGSGCCYCLYSIRTRRRLPYARFHYLSDASVFAERWRDVQRVLLRRHGALFGEADARLFPSTPVPGALVTDRRTGGGLFRSNRVCPARISELYSEIVLLGL